jgi:hypothetical protein
MHRSVLVKSVQDHHFQGMADKGFKTITLDMPHLDSTNQYNFEPAWDTNNGKAPAAGIHIDCDIEESVTKKGMKVYNIATWSPAGPPNGGPQQAAATLPQDLQQRLNQAIAIESDVNPHPMGDAVKLLADDGRTLSILLQTIIKGSSDPVQADAYLRWYIERLANPGIVFVDPK